MRHPRDYQRDDHRSCCRERGTDREVSAAVAIPECEDLEASCSDNRFARQLCHWPFEPLAQVHSRRTSFAFLSWHRPTNRECRWFSSAVHSRTSICGTRSGFNHVHSAISMKAVRLACPHAVQAAAPSRNQGRTLSGSRSSGGAHPAEPAIGHESGEQPLGLVCIGPSETLLRLGEGEAASRIERRTAHLLERTPDDQAVSPTGSRAQERTRKPRPQHRTRGISTAGTLLRIAESALVPAACYARSAGPPAIRRHSRGTGPFLGAPCQILPPLLTTTLNCSRLT
jgi:hypothetical protein